MSVRYYQEIHSIKKNENSKKNEISKKKKSNLKKNEKKKLSGLKNVRTQSISVSDNVNVTKCQSQTMSGSS